MDAQIGLRKDMEQVAVAYYEQNYDVVRTPDLDDSTRLLKPKHGIKYIGNKKQKVCRFCGKSEPEVMFKKIAHAMPESIGNHALATYYECDECNHFFGQHLENEYNKFFIFFHSILKVKGKRGIQESCFKVPCDKRKENCSDYCVEIKIKDNMPSVRKCREVEQKYVELKENQLIISKPIGKCCPIAVYKALVKMALTVLPEEELSLFSEVIKWIKEPEHRNFYMDRHLLVRYKMIPGYDVTKYPHFVIYRQKKDKWGLPYLLFNLTYGCYSMLIEVPRNSDINSDEQFRKIIFPPIPFYTVTEGLVRKNWHQIACKAFAYNSIV